MIYHSLKLYTLSGMSRSVRYVVVTEKTVAARWLEEIHAMFSLEKMDYDVIVLPLQENSKNRETKALLEDLLLEKNVCKNCCLIALGGGVVTDLVGFTAATFMRGIPYVNIPTTLLAMVDASIGGKTGINHETGKNLIGIFHESQDVIIDLMFLDTLSSQQIDCGFTEIIKYGLALDKELVSAVAKKQYAMDSLIMHCIGLKQQITKKDPFDRGIRKVLNLGHTVGHALETLSSYAISHGDAVKVGLLVEASVSMYLNILSEKDFIYVYSLLQDRELDMSLFAQFDPLCIFHAMKGDKKSVRNRPHMVLLEAIGRCYCHEGDYVYPISEDTWVKSLQAGIYAL